MKMSLLIFKELRFFFYENPHYIGIFCLFGFSNKNPFEIDQSKQKVLSKNKIRILT